jgi:hypothetical protein
VRVSKSPSPSSTPWLTIEMIIAKCHLLSLEAGGPRRQGEGDVGGSYARGGGQQDVAAKRREEQAARSGEVGEVGGRGGRETPRVASAASQVSSLLAIRMLTFARVCARMLTYADGGELAPLEQRSAYVKHTSAYVSLFACFTSAKVQIRRRASSKY